MEVEYRYGVEDELSRVLKTLEKLSWYREQGYRPILPEGISETSSKEDVRSAVEHGYREEEFLESKKKICIEFSENLDRYLAVLFQYSSVSLTKLVVKLTQYGTSGSYQVPNFIVVALHDSRGEKTIYHEIAHLVFENEFEKHRVSHWHKERIIDLLLHTEEMNFLNYTMWQRDYHGAEDFVDALFHEDFATKRASFYNRLCGRL